MMVGQEIERSRVVRARQQHQRAGFRRGAERVGDGRKLLAVRAAGRNFQRLLVVPRNFRKPRIVAASDPHRQILRAQISRNRRRHFIGGAELLRGPENLLDLILEHVHPLSRRLLRARGNQSARMARDAVLDRGLARRLAPVDAERAANRAEYQIAAAHDLPSCLRRRCSRCHCAWNVEPSGAGKSRNFVQPRASGRKRKRPRQPSSESTPTATPVASR